MTKKNSLLLLIVFSLLTVVFVFSLLSLKINVSSEFLLPEKSSSRENMKRMEDTFGQTQQIVAVVKTDGLFKKENSLKIHQFLLALSRVEGVTGYNSYQDAAKLSLIGGTRARPYFENGIPTEDATEIVSNPLYLDNLLDSSGKVALVSINIDERADAGRVLKVARETLQGLEFYFSGEPVVDEELNGSILSFVLIYPPILFGLICFIYYLRLGSMRAAVMPSLLSIFAALWTYGLGSILGFEINILTSTVALFIVIISSSYGLHFIDRYITNRRALERVAALKRTMKEERIPIFLSALTTAVGFLTFLISSLEAFKQLGMLVSLGIMISSALTLLILPALLSFFDLPVVERKLKFFKLSREKARKTDKIILVAVVLFAAISPFLISRIVQNFDQFDYFRPDTTIVKSAQAIREEFGWNMPFYVILEKNSLFTGNDAMVISELIDRIEALERVHGVGSIMDVVEAFSIPLPLLQLAANNGSLPLEQYMIENKVRLLVKTPNTDAVNSGILAEHLREILKDYEQYSPYVASPLLIISGVNSEILNSQIGTIIWATVAIAILLLIVFRSFKLALVAIVPIVLSVFFNFAYMGLLGLKLEISTAMVSGILLGLTIDYAIHLIGRFIETKDIHRARQEVKPAILSNTLALVVGFASLVFAPLKLFSGLGLLLALGMATGALLTLVVIPYILRGKGRLI